MNEKYLKAQLKFLEYAYNSARRVIKTQDKMLEEYHDENLSLKKKIERLE